MFQRRLVLFLVLAFPFPVAAQYIDSLRSAASSLPNKGFAFSLDLYDDTFLASDATTGKRSATAQQFADLGISFQPGETVTFLKNSEFFFSLHVNGMAHAGLGGPAQPISSLDSSAGVHLAEIWIEQRLSRTFHIRAGRIDANRDFALIENAASFVNSSAGYTPTFFGLPNYNDTRAGVELLLTTGKLSWNTGVFHPVEGTGAVFMTEFARHWAPSGWDGRVSLGLWKLSGKSPDLHGDNVHGAQGMYAVVEQKFWRHARDHHNEQSLTGFTVWGTSPAAFSTFARHLGLGILWNAPLARRDADALGITMSRATFSPLAGHGHETVWESFYRVQLTSSLSVSPDIQYITHVAGSDPRHNLLAVGARMNLSLETKSE